MLLHVAILGSALVNRVVHGLSIIPKDLHQQRHVTLRDLDSCSPPGQLLFLHIMKTGGSSVEVFLDCYCDQVGCGMFVHDGVVTKFKGKAACNKESAVCSTHANYEDRVEACGTHFENPKYIFA